MIFVFDIECYRNFFSVIFKDVKTKEVITFVIHELSNDLDSLVEFINDPKKWLVGYNSHYYDNQMLNYISKNYHILSQIDSAKINNLLKKQSDLCIYDDDKSYKYRLPFRGIDLMRVGNLDMKPLKLVAVNLKWPKIQDLPIHHDELIKPEQFELLLKYNLNDVEITEALYNKILPFIKLRWDISKQYNVNVMDESDSGISNRLLEKIFSEALDIPVRDLKEQQTIRSRIPFTDIIFPDIKFQTQQLKNLLERLKTQVFEEGVSTFKEKVIYGGTAYQLGIGGIHSDDKPGLFNEDDRNKLIDADIASMYPSLIINHRLYPEHLGDEFIEKYDDIRKTRVDAKHRKDMVVADSLKIVLNSAYGKTNSKTHWLRDMRVTLRTTVNGQLYLLMLIEHLTLAGFQIISANTDGIVTVVPRDREDFYKKLCAEWERWTDFELEYTEYVKYARRDVNNYMTLKSDGKIKRKGEFEIETPLMKGFNCPIVPIALSEYYLNSIPIEKTIMEHEDIYDFCIAKKSDKKFTNEFHYLKDRTEKAVDKLQQTNRYYVSNNGGKLYKNDKSKNRLTDVCVGHTLTLFNDYVESEDYDIDYQYYISKARKIKDLIESPQLTLF